MASSLRNFIITFVLAFALFGWLAWTYYGDIEALLPQAGAEGTSDDGSAEVSDDTPSSVIIINGEGDNLGTLNGLVVLKDEEGIPIAARFLRYNSKVRKIISCDLSLSATVYNDVNVVMPLRDYLRCNTIGKAAEAICSLTGYEADFYLELNPSSISRMISNMNGAYYFLKQDLQHINPAYADIAYEPGDTLPADYYVEIKSGQLTLNQKKLAQLLEHFTVCDGTEDGHRGKEAFLRELCFGLLHQIVREQKTIMESDPDRLSRVLSGGFTNMNSAFLREHSELLFKYEVDAYDKITIPYTSRDGTLHAIKQADRARS